MQQSQANSIIDEEDDILQDILEFPDPYVPTQTNNESVYRVKENKTQCIEEVEVKYLAKILLRLSAEIGSDSVKRVVKLIPTYIFKPGVVIECVND